MEKRFAPGSSAPDREEPPAIGFRRTRNVADRVGARTLAATRRFRSAARKAPRDRCRLLAWVALARAVICHARS